jgi:hypothetical protein
MILFPVPVEATATNRPLPYVIEFQLFAAAPVLKVHVIPSGEVMTLFVVEVADTATKRPLP